MHSALSPPWTPFGPCSTKLGVSSFLCRIPLCAFKDSQASVTWFECVKQLCWARWEEGTRSVLVPSKYSVCCKREH